MEYAVCHLGVKTVAVLGHGRCGAIKAVASSSGGTDAYIPGWVYHGHQAYVTLLERMPYPNDEAGQVEWLCELEKENVRLQLKHLRTYPVITTALAANKISVVGLYYDMATGVASQVEE
jgi:carbonic anhydrase